MSKNKALVGAAAVVLVAAGVTWAVVGRGAGAVEVSVEKAARGPLEVTVSAAGSVAPGTKADIFPPAAGTLASIEVSEGQQVKAGDVIAVMDTRPLELQVAQAQAAYDAALAQADAVGQQQPSSADEKAASAAVTAAWSAYQAAAKQYELVSSGGVSDPAALQQAQTAVTLAQAAYDAAAAAYDAYKASVYDPAPEPKDPTIVEALEALESAKQQAADALAAAQANLAALTSAGANPTAVASAKAARDQAWAAYQAALAQQEKLARADTRKARSSAAAGVEAARQALEYAAGVLERATLRAPIDGTVLFNSATAALPASALGGSGGGAAGGEPVVGSAVSPASAPFTVVALDDLTFEAQVDEADVVNVKPGMKATVVLDSLPGRSFATTVERIGTASVVTPTGGTAFPVVFRLANAKETVLLGMNGTAEIVVESLQDVLSVPIEAVLDDAGTSYVYTVRDGKAKRVEVTTGRMTETRAEIVSGLTAGDEVIVGGLSSVKDGAAVKVK
ncbi:efflux RND transporter periplasmic adaptor subunit [Coriobacteriia bacterium Es71-Z0120]|uniref:efflux RND transporter periplasmic adaptor subunit n=1 Tax=Parvivirga hydrogeniphila TaxID=2939460 RepID=UPI002260C827|nr:efflux RND transporter periplasmic adaptor subunit [Parvivirga hydrogeniphila]MCL4078198.1 efflux RND transporter periplasmic adaptor subunit [Parvivirga hydrogeniphila]